MKGRHWFVVGIVAFLLLMFAIEYRLPKRFVWRPTFGHYDEQPFGCALFDSLVSVSASETYTLSRKTFYQLAFEDTLKRRGFLAISEHLALSDVDVEALLSMASRGDKVLLVSNLFPARLEDTLRVHGNYSYFYFNALKKQAVSLFARDSLIWIASPGDSLAYYFYPQLCASTLSADSADADVLAIKHEVVGKNVDGLMTDTLQYSPVALSVPVGKGEIILVSTPLLFTNYGVVDGNNAAYIFRILSQMKGLPLVRTEAYVDETSQAQQSPFRYLLAHRPLRWALYLTLTGIVLFMFFTTRRRQRAILVVRPPLNKSLEFVKLIGTLYFQKKDHADLVRKKYIYFAEMLRRSLQVDLEAVEEDIRSFDRIAKRTGIDKESIAVLVRTVRSVVYDKSAKVSEQQMKRLIDNMNDITRNLL